MDLSKTRQRFALAAGGSLKSAPPKTDMDKGKSESPSQHRWRGEENNGEGFTHPDYPEPRGGGPGM